MEVKTETKMVEVTATTYVAVDGTEFNREVDCIDYEKGLTESELKAKADKLRLVDLDDTYPLDTNGQYINDNYSYTWYQVNNENEYNILAELYGDGISKSPSYPDIVCIETDEYYSNDAWSYWLSDMMQSTLIFWKNFGYEVEFKER